MNINVLKNYDIFTVDNCNKKDINISVYLVSKSSFNDERLIAEKTISIENLCNKPLEWFDVYLGKNNRSIKIAFLHIDEEYLYFYIEADNEMKICSSNSFYSYIFTDDYNDYHIISAHIW